MFCGIRNHIWQLSNGTSLDRIDFILRFLLLCYGPSFLSSHETEQLPIQELLPIAICYIRHPQKSVISGALRLIAALCHRVSNLHQQIMQELLLQLSSNSEQLVMVRVARSIIY